MSARLIDGLRVRAEQGDPEAQFNVGMMYATGRGVWQNDSAAAYWFRQAAEQGMPEAMTKLGVMCGTGRGMMQDGAEAVRWYRRAVDWWRQSAEAGDPSAMSNLGTRYASGWGVSQDYVKAYMWRSLAVFRLSGEKREQLLKTRDSLANLMTVEDLTEAERLVQDWEALHPKNP